MDKNPNARDWLVPNLANSFTVLMFLMIVLASCGGAGYEPTIVVSGLLLLVSVPPGVILVWLTIRRFKRGTNSIGVTLYQVASFLLQLRFGASFW